jgi:aspartate aminotransferase
MTGWRIGYAAGPAPLIAAMKNIQSQSTSNPTSIAQVATQVALEGDQSFIGKMNEIFKQRHDLVYNRLNALPGFECLPSNGTFYSFPRVEKAIKTLGLKNDLEFSELLLTQAQVAVVPGSAFGCEGYIRLSYATSEELLNKALDRMAALMEVREKIVV